MYSMGRAVGCVQDEVRFVEVSLVGDGRRERGSMGGGE